MPPKTLAAVKSHIARVFPREDAEISGMVDSEFEVWVQSLCRIHPWWFNWIRPGDASEAFPLPEDPEDILTGLPTNAGRWFHRGWLLTEADVGVYEFRAPYNDVYPAFGFHDCQVDQIHFIKAHTCEGQFAYEIPVKNTSWAHSHTNHASDGEGSPYIAWVETFPEVSILRLHPAPLEAIPLAIEFCLTYCPSYTNTNDGEDYNRLSSAAPELIEYYALMKLAEYFGEDTMYRHYERVLYGEPALGVTVPGATHGGLLSQVRAQGERMSISSDVRWENYMGAQQPYAAGARRGRWGGHGRYYSSHPYP